MNWRRKRRVILTHTQGDKVVIAGPRLFSLFKEGVDTLYKEQPEV